MDSTLAQPTSSIVAVLVTYRPDAARLEDVVRAIQQQVDHVVVVDNGSGAEMLRWIGARDNVSMLLLDSNRGIAFAQNRGIDRCRALGASHVLLLDQDSVADEGMVGQLLAALDALNKEGRRVGAVGPGWIDGRADVLPRFTVFRRARYLQIEAPAGARAVECDMLIASGTLIPVSTLDVVGSMNEGLFIDKVDTEWSLRVRAAGLGLYGVPAAHLHHRIGESVLTVNWWRGKRLSVHKPFRYYYMVRNSVLLQRTPGMRWSWRFADATQMVKIIIFHGLLAPDAGDNRGMILRGLRDGLRSVTGPMSAR